MVCALRFFGQMRQTHEELPQITYQVVHALTGQLHLWIMVIYSIAVLVSIWAIASWK